MKEKGQIANFKCSQIVIIFFFFKKKEQLFTYYYKFISRFANYQILFFQDGNVYQLETTERRCKQYGKRLFRDSDLSQKLMKITFSVKFNVIRFQVYRNIIIYFSFNRQN